MTYNTQREKLILPEYGRTIQEMVDICMSIEDRAAEEIAERPKPLKYPMQRIRFRHYGHLTEAFMKELKEMPEGEDRERLTSMMANFMKRSLYNWNRDAMDERKVAADLSSYTDGQAALSEDFHFASVSNGHLPGSNASKKKRKR